MLEPLIAGEDESFRFGIFFLTEEGRAEKAFEIVTKRLSRTIPFPQNNVIKGRHSFHDIARKQQLVVLADSGKLPAKCFAVALRRAELELTANPMPKTFSPVTRRPEKPGMGSDQR